MKLSEMAFAKKTYRFRLPGEVHIAVLYYGRGGEKTYHHVVAGTEIKQLVQLMKQDDTEAQIDELLDAKEDWDAANSMSMVAAAFAGHGATLEISEVDHIGIAEEEHLIGVAATSEKAKRALEAMIEMYPAPEDPW